MATVIDLINAIQATAGTDYSTRVPVATQNNITTVGNAILSLPQTKETFLNVLINKVTLTIVNSKIYTNILAGFYKGELPFGYTIEELYADIVTASNYSGTATNVFDKATPNVKTLFHSMDRQLQYTITVSDEQLKQAFMNEQKLSEFVQAIIQSMYNSRYFDEFVMTKQLLGSYDGAVAEVKELDPAVLPAGYTSKQELALEFLKQISQASRNLTFMTKTYNKMQVNTWTPEAEQVLIIHKDVITSLENNLSGVFNLDLVVPKMQKIVIDDFGTKSGRYAMLLDKNAIKIYNTLQSTESIRNPKGLYYNYFHNLWAIYSISTFHNVISFELPAV